MSGAGVPLQGTVGAAGKTATRDLPETVYDAQPELSRPAVLVRNIVRDLAASRGLAWRLFVRNLRGLYRQTLLGLFWVFLPPVANTAIWAFLRSRNVFSFDAGLKVDPTIYILAGMVLWQSFIEALQMPLESLNRNKSMISKLNFPREALVLEGFADLVFHLLVRLAVLMPAALLFGVAIDPLAWLLALPVSILLIGLGVGMGLILAPLGSLYHDVGRLLLVAGPFWMIVTPIIYVAPASYPGSLLVWLNPAAPLLVATRDLLVLGQTMHGFPAGILAALTLPLLLLGLIVWRVSIPALVERMST